MKYYIIDLSIGTDAVYIEDSKIEREVIHKLIDGELIDAIDLTHIKLKNTTKKLHDLLGTGSSDFFFSDEMKVVIEKFENKENLNFLPATIKSRQYWLLNILNNVECFDWEKSEYTTYENPNILKKVSKIVLKEEKIKDRNLFRIAEDPINIFVSEKLKESLEELNFTGFKFDSRIYVE